LVLRYYAGATDTEIAMTLGLAAGTVKTHIRRGLEALTRQLEDRR
jgi:DNA-directed RNA polymerase specialized sigma24 family protein